MTDKTEHSHSHPDYWKIYKWLLILFLISVAGPWLSPGIKIIVLLSAFGIAVVKALLVAANFMHLNVERKYIWYLFLACFAFLFVLFAGVAPDVMNKHGNNWVNNARPAALSVDPAEPDKPAPVVTPPVETPPVDTPPVAVTPPKEKPPEETPPEETPPVVVTPPKEKPPEEKPPELDPKLVAAGKALFQTKICFTCHQTDPNVPALAGAALKAPAFVGSFWGVEREVAVDANPDETGFQAGGKTEKVKMDDAYFLESVENPFAKIVVGALPGMAPLPTTLEEREALAAYVRSLSK